MYFVHVHCFDLTPCLPSFGNAYKPTSEKMSITFALIEFSAKKLNETVDWTNQKAMLY